jgi:hypothetical protein
LLEHAGLPGCRLGGFEQRGHVLDVLPHEVDGTGDVDFSRPPEAPGEVFQPQCELVGLLFLGYSGRDRTPHGLGSHETFLEREW